MSVEPGDAIGDHSFACRALGQGLVKHVEIFKAYGTGTNRGDADRGCASFRIEFGCANVQQAGIQMMSSQDKSLIKFKRAAYFF